MEVGRDKRGPTLPPDSFFGNCNSPKLVTPAQAGAQGNKQDLATGQGHEALISRMSLGPRLRGGDKGEEVKLFGDKELLCKTRG